MGAESELEAVAYYLAAIDLARSYRAYPHGGEMLNLAIARCEQARAAVDVDQGYVSEWLPLPQRVAVVR